MLILQCPKHCRNNNKDYSKAFDKKWHSGLPYKLFNYFIPGRVFTITKSFSEVDSLKLLLMVSLLKPMRSINPTRFSSQSYSLYTFY